MHNGLSEKLKEIANKKEAKNSFFAL